MPSRNSVKRMWCPLIFPLHGGEVTTLPKQEFHDLIQYISRYYQDMRELITDAGFRVGHPHIKTNLYGLDRHIETIREFNVSISGSLDLPLSLHEKYRVTKGGEGTLERILDNIRLLEEIPDKKKVSATSFGSISNSWIRSSRISDSWTGIRAWT